MLLPLRKTATLGGLIAMQVLSNVLMLTVSYEIRLKMWGFNLILFIISILILDGKKLLQI